MSNKQNIQETLVSMGFQRNYIVRAFKVYEANYGHSYNIEVITEIITRLQRKDKHAKATHITSNIHFTYTQNNISFEIINNTPFISHMHMDDALKLKINDKIDHRDEVGRFIQATVIDKKNTNLQIRYRKFPITYDTWSDFSKELYRFAKPKSISKRLAHRFENIKEGGYIDVNPIRHPGWKIGQVKSIPSSAGQIQFSYQIASSGTHFLCWAHVDNINEVAEFKSKEISKVSNNNNDNINNNNINMNNNNSKKRKLSDGDCDMEPQPKKRKLLNNDNDVKDTDNDNDSIDIYKQIVVLEQQNGDLTMRNETMEKRLNLLECESKTINAMSLDELNKLKIMMQKKMKLIEEAERQLMENTFKCVACMDNLKNISFDACDHIALCDKCEETLQSKLCPMCQVPYNNVKKVRF